MPEAFAVLAVVVVTIVAWFSAWMHARNPANTNAQAEIARLRQHAAWLEQRMEVAQREKWGGDMIATLSDEMEGTARQLVRARSVLGRSVGKPA